MLEIILTFTAFLVLILLFFIYDLRMSLKRLPSDLKNAMDESIGGLGLVKITSELLKVRNELDNLKRQIEEHKKQA